MIRIVKNLLADHIGPNHNNVFAKNMCKRKIKIANLLKKFSYDYCDNCNRIATRNFVGKILCEHCFKLFCKSIAEIMNKEPCSICNHSLKDHWTKKRVFGCCTALLDTIQGYRTIPKQCLCKHYVPKPHIFDELV